MTTKRTKNRTGKLVGAVFSLLTLLASDYSRTIEDNIRLESLFISGTGPQIKSSSAAGFQTTTSGTTIRCVQIAFFTNLNCGIRNGDPQHVSTNDNGGAGYSPSANTPFYLNSTSAYNVGSRGSLPSPMNSTQSISIYFEDTSTCTGLGGHTQYWDSSEATGKGQTSGNPSTSYGCFNVTCSGSQCTSSYSPTVVGIYDWHN